MIDEFSVFMSNIVQKMARPLRFIMNIKNNNFFFKTMKKDKYPPIDEDKFVSTRISYYFVPASTIYRKLLKYLEGRGARDAQGRRKGAG